MNEIVKIIRERVKDYADTVGYGHIGDGNVHLNITLKNKDDLDIV